MKKTKQLMVLNSWHLYTTPVSTFKNVSLINADIIVFLDNYFLLVSRVLESLKSFGRVVAFFSPGIFIYLFSVPVSEWAICESECFCLTTSKSLSMEKHSREICVQL